MAELDLDPRYTRIPCGCVFGTEPLPDGGQAFVYNPCSVDCEYYQYARKAAAEQGKPFHVTDLRDVGRGSVEVPGSACPACGQVNEMAYDVSGEGATPKPGDWTLCSGCAASLLFDDTLKTRLPTETELAEVPAQLAVMQRRAMDSRRR